MEATEFTQAAGPTTTYLTFRLGENVLGLGMDQVNEIVRHAATTPVPLTPPWIRGVFNLRGRVLPAVDLGVRLGLAPLVEGRRTCVLVLEILVEGLRFSAGILVDEVRDLLELANADVDPPPPFGAGIKVEFVRGVYHRGEHPLLLLDVTRVFSEDELMQVALIDQRLRAENERSRQAEKLASVARATGSDDGDAALDWGSVNRASAGEAEGAHFFDEE
jgi:purine-binding chemotaxis protein CheW